MRKHFFFWKLLLRFLQTYIQGFLQRFMQESYQIFFQVFFQKFPQKLYHSRKLQKIPGMVLFRNFLEIPWCYLWRILEEILENFQEGLPDRDWCFGGFLGWMPVEMSQNIPSIPWRNHEKLLMILWKKIPGKVFETFLKKYFLKLSAKIPAERTDKAIGEILEEIPS